MTINKETPLNNDLTAGRAMFGLGALFCLAVAFGSLIQAPCDDAYIFFVYAKNFVQGNGVTYNGMREWGFTSVGWQALLCLGGLLPAPLPLIGMAFSALSGAFALGATYFLGRTLSLNRSQSLLPVLLLAFTGDFTYYMYTGLEQVAFTGLIAVCAALTFRDSTRGMRESAVLATMMSLLILTRPEGALIAGLFLIVAVVRTRSLWSSVRCGLLIILMIGPVAAALRVHYGDWLPNTYYAKSGVGFANLDKGLYYLAYSVFRYGLPMIVGLLVLKRFEGSLARASEPLALFAVSAIWMTYVTVQGGDNLVGGRQIIPILPLCYVGLIRLCSRITMRRLAPAVIAIAVALTVSYVADPRVKRHTTGERIAAKVRREAGLYLRENFVPTTRVALNPAGIIPFYSELPTIDMLGLNNHAIARSGKRDLFLAFGHQVGDGEYVLSIRPEIILLGGSLDPRPAFYISDREIGRSNQFHIEYERVEWDGIGTAYLRRDAMHLMRKINSDSASESPSPRA